MDKLSPEILHMILDHLVPPALRKSHDQSLQKCAPLAVISRTWQYVVERVLFADITIDGTPEGIAEFGAIYSQPQRRAVLRDVYLDAFYKCSAAPDTHNACKHENTALMASLAALFQIMDGWRMTPPTTGTRLERSPPGLKLTLTSVHFKPGEQKSLFTDLVAWKNTEAAKCVTCLHVHKSVHYLTACRVPALFCNLRDLYLQLLPPTYKDNTHHHLFRMRSALIRALLDARTSLPHLESLTVDLGADEPSDRKIPSPDLRAEDGVDELCEAIRLLSHTAPLRKLNLQGIHVSPDLFQDCRLPAGEQDSTAWPLLEKVSVDFPSVASSGMWYFWDLYDVPARGRGEPWRKPLCKETTDHDISPRAWDINPNVFDPLQMAFARAILRMPALRSGTLSMSSCRSPTLAVGMMNRSMALGAFPSTYGRGMSTLFEKAQTVQRADAGLDRRERVIRVEGLLCHRAVYETVSRSKPWEPETMFQQPSPWVPTPEIVALWTEWLMRG